MEKGNKSVANRAKVLREIKKILGIIVLGFVLYTIINALTSNGMKSFYCLSDDKCITVWKKINGEVYILFEEYKSGKVPSDNYVKILNMSYGYISVILSKDNKLIIDVEDKAEVKQKSSNDLIELYRDNKTLNDSLYTYFDGRYRHYKKDVDYISINIKENYATDKTGKKIE